MSRPTQHLPGLTPSRPSLSHPTIRLPLQIPRTAGRKHPRASSTAQRARHLPSTPEPRCPHPRTAIMSKRPRKAPPRSPAPLHPSTQGISASKSRRAAPSRARTRQARRETPTARQRRGRPGGLSIACPVRHACECECTHALAGVEADVMCEGWIDRRWGCGVEADVMCEVWKYRRWGYVVMGRVHQVWSVA